MAGEPEEARTLRLGIPREVYPGERRVAVSPDTVERLKKLGFEVVVEHGAGAGAQFPDTAYTEAGALLESDVRKLWSTSDLVLKVRPPTDHDRLETHEVELLPSGGTLISLLQPGVNTELVKRLGKRGANVIALDCVPRISRAQKMDVLSSMANIAGYRAVIEASHRYGRFFGGQITAAGRTPPARVLVIGAGVAGLAAIATARSLGAEVRAFDVRAATREQVQSLGASFLEVEMEESGEGEGGYAKQMSEAFIEAEMALFKQQAAEVDIIITTALIPGKRAPLLIKTEAIEVMRPGSVIVDMAAEAGGNVELTRPHEVYDHQGVAIIGYTDLTSRLPAHASRFFGNNLAHLLEEMGGATDYSIDMENEAVRGAVVLHKGELTWPPPRVEPSPAPRPAEAQPTTNGTAVAAATPAPAPTSTGHGKSAKEKTQGAAIGALVAAAVIAGVGAVAPPDFIGHFTVFVLAIFIGWQVVWNVTPALHTPLMSVTNAISGIIIVGGMLQAGHGSELSAAAILGAVAILVATINIAGGFLVTQRMLQMFRKGGS